MENERKIVIMRLGHAWLDGVDRLATICTWVSK